MKDLFETDRPMGAVVLVLALALFAVMIFGPVKAEEFRPVCTPNAPELISSFAEDGVKRVVMSVQIIGVRKGDWFTVTGEMEGTDNTGQWANFERAIVLGSTPTAIDASNGGAWVTESNGDNFNANSCFIGTCDVHHISPTKANMIDSAPADLPVAYFNFLVWAKTSPPKPGNLITVEPGYGKMCVKQGRP